MKNKKLLSILAYPVCKFPVRLNESKNMLVCTDCGREYIAVLFPFSNNRLVYSIIREITGWLTFPFKYLDIIMSRKKYAGKIANSFFYLGKKTRETVDK